jgi:hypothetical protein
MLNHLFYQNPVAFANYNFILNKNHQLRRLIAILKKNRRLNRGEQMSISSRFYETRSFEKELTKNRLLCLFIAINRTINRSGNRDIIVYFNAILITWGYSSFGLFSPGKKPKEKIDEAYNKHVFYIKLQV